MYPMVNSIRFLSIYIISINKTTTAFIYNIFFYSCSFKYKQMTSGLFVVQCFEFKPFFLFLLHFNYKILLYLHSTNKYFCVCFFQYLVCKKCHTFSCSQLLETLICHLKVKIKWKTTLKTSLIRNYSHTKNEFI